MQRLSFARLIMMPLVLLIGTTTSAHAARLLNYTITVDGKTWKTGIYSDDGHGDTPRIWSYLRDVRFQTEAGGTDQSRPGDDPLRRQLKGDIRLRVDHAGKMIAEAKLSELVLVRTDPARDEWSLAPDEVERTRKAAGLPAPPAEEGKLYWDVFLWIVIAVLLGLVIFRLLHRRRSVQPAPPG